MLVGVLVVLLWSDIEDYRRHSDLLEKRVTHDLAVLFNKIRSLPVPEMTNILAEFIPALIDKYGTECASFAAQWFEDLTGVSASVPDLYRGTQWADSVREGFKPVVNDESLRAAYVGAVRGALRAVKNYGRFTVANSARVNDGVSYARVMTGASNCSFCVVLSSRGPVYWSEMSAGGRGSEPDKYHLNCDCIVVPLRGSWQPDSGALRGRVWRGELVKGYDFDALYKREYLPFHKRQDSINEVVARRDRFYREYFDAKAVEALEYAASSGSVDFPRLRKDLWEKFRDEKDAAYDALPVEQWANAKPLPRRFVSVPVAWDDKIPGLSMLQWNRILYGMPTGGGHLHGYGWIAGGAEFDRNMTPAQIALMLKSELSKRDNPTGWLGKHDVVINGTNYRIVCRDVHGMVMVKSFYPLDPNRKSKKK